jgi:monoamine oxidase
MDASPVTLAQSYSTSGASDVKQSGKIIVTGAGFGGRAASLRLKRPGHAVRWVGIYSLAGLRRVSGGAC